MTDPVPPLQPWPLRRNSTFPHLCPGRIDCAICRWERWQWAYRKPPEPHRRRTPRSQHETQSQEGYRSHDAD